MWQVIGLMLVALSVYVSMLAVRDSVASNEGTFGLCCSLIGPVFLMLMGICAMVVGVHEARV